MSIGLTPAELQNLISRGLITIRPPETVSLKTLENRAWREMNPEKASAMNKARYLRRRAKKTKEEISGRKYHTNKRWRDTHREQYLASRRARYDRNRETILAKKRDDYALKKQSDHANTEPQQMQIPERLETPVQVHPVLSCQEQV